MATTCYFAEDLSDSASEKTVSVEFGTTNFAGDGPQFYLNFGNEGLILSHDDAAKFCRRVAEVARYLGYQTK